MGDTLEEPENNGLTSKDLEKAIEEGFDELEKVFFSLGWPKSNAHFFKNAWFKMIFIMINHFYDIGSFPMPSSQKFFGWGVKNILESFIKHSRY